MTSYTTIKHSGVATFEDRKSIFIGSAQPVQNEEEAIAFVKKIKSEYPDARHNVYAYVIKENSITRYSDDGEPQGTAGMPVLDVIRKNDCTNVAIVVTRYFGGILLGTGGLVHAYTEAAKNALLDGEIMTLRMHDKLKIKCGYPEYNKIKFKIDTNNYKIDGLVFTDSVEFFVIIIEEMTDNFIKDINELCAGRVEIEACEKIFDSIL